MSDSKITMALAPVFLGNFITTLALLILGINIIPSTCIGIGILMAGTALWLESAVTKRQKKETP